MMKKTTFTIFMAGILVMVMLAGVFSAVTIKSVSSSPAEIAPGKTSDITLKIENIFDDPVTNLNVKLDFSSVPFAPYQSSSEKFLDELEDGDSETFTFRVIALPSASTGIYKIPVQISYAGNNNTILTKQELISMTVNTLPKLTVSIDSTQPVIKGKENQISIKVVNSGLADVKFLYISAADSGGITFNSAREQYVGDVTSDDFDTIEFSVFANQNSLSMVSIPVTLKYLDSTNKEFTETKEIIIKTYSLEEAQALGLVGKPSYFGYIIVVLLAVAYWIYRILKKRRLKKQRSS